MGIGDIWDSIVDGLDYLIHFEWVGDFADMFADMFENIGEFSFYGIAMGLIGVIGSYSTKYLNLSGNGMSMIQSMTQYMPPVQRIIWTVLTYAAVFIAGYLFGKTLD